MGHRMPVTSYAQQRFADIGVYAQEVKAASASSDAFERVTKQIDLMYSIAKALPLTNPQVRKQGDATASGSLPAVLCQCFRVFWLKIKHLMALQCTRCSQDLSTMRGASDSFAALLPWGRNLCLRLQDERMQDMMVDLRGRFKVICARLGLPEKLQFDAVGLPEEVAVRPSYDF